MQYIYIKKIPLQHFLKDESIIQRIIAVLKENNFSNLPEVGPGAGVLTKYLVEIPTVDFKAMELD